MKHLLKENKFENEKSYPEAGIYWISDVKKENIGDLIKTQGIITSTDYVNPVIIRKVYICKACQRLHKITEKDSQENQEKCLKCAGSLKPIDHGLYDDTQLMTIQDIFDTKRTEIYASTLGDEAYYGKYQVGDYVNLIARIDRRKLNNRNKLILKIEEIKKVNITLNMAVGKKIWKTKPITEAQKARGTKENRQWRMDVLESDNFTCQKCDEYYKYFPGLEAHHIYNFWDHPHLRYEIDNGIALCEDCHKDFHKIYGLTNNDKYQLEEFLRLNQYIES